MTQAGYRSNSNSSSSSIFSKLLLGSGFCVLGGAVIYFFYGGSKNRSMAKKSEENAVAKVATVIEDPTQKSSPVFSQMASPAGSDQSFLSASSFPTAKTPMPRKIVSFDLKEQEKHDVEEVQKPVSENDLLSKEVEAPILTAQQFCPSPTTSSSLLSPLPSMCDCRELQEPPKVLTDDDALFSEDSRFEGQLTKVKPYNFQKYEPCNLIIMSDEEAACGLSSAARELEKPAQETVFTAFYPVLQCVVYASQHSMLIHELLSEYSYLASFKE